MFRSLDEFAETFVELTDFEMHRRCCNLLEENGGRENWRRVLEDSANN